MSDRYSLAQLVALSGVRRDTIRHWVREGWLPGSEGSGSQRYYTSEHLRRIHLIKERKRTIPRMADIARSLDNATS